MLQGKCGRIFMSSILLINLFDKAKVLIIKANEKLQRKRVQSSYV